VREWPAKFPGSGLHRDDGSTECRRCPYCGCPGIEKFFQLSDVLCIPRSDGGSSLHCGMHHFYTGGFRARVIADRAGDPSGSGTVFVMMKLHLWHSKIRFSAPSRFGSREERCIRVLQRVHRGCSLTLSGQREGMRSDMDLTIRLEQQNPMPGFRRLSARNRTQQT
jgi:hypothetical protein